MRKGRYPPWSLETLFCEVLLPPIYSVLSKGSTQPLLLSPDLEKGKDVGGGARGENTLQAERKMEMNPLGDEACRSYVHFQVSPQRNQEGGGKGGGGRIQTDGQSLKKWHAADQCRIMSDKVRD